MQQLTTNELKKGDIVYIRAYPELKTEHLEKHKIIDIVTLGDGEKIVVHKQENLFFILSYPIECTSLKEFLLNTSKPL